MLDVFDQKIIQSYLISDHALSKQLISLYENEYVTNDNDDSLTEVFRYLKKVVKHPIIQQHLYDVDKSKRYLQQILDLACQQGNWDQQFKSIVSDLAWDYRLELFHCPGLYKLSNALTTKVISDYIGTEDKASRLGLPQLIDLIMEEGKDLSNRSVFWFFARNTDDSCYEHCPQDLCSFDLRNFDQAYLVDSVLPFYYPKIAWALMHPEVKQQVDVGTLSVQELSERLKGDPLSGYRAALFGLSGEHNAHYVKRIDENYGRLSAVSSLSFDLTIEQFVRMIREDRWLVVNGSPQPLGKILNDLSGLCRKNDIAVAEVMQDSDEAILKLWASSMSDPDENSAGSD